MRLARYVFVLFLLARGVAATILVHPHLDQAGSATIIVQPAAGSDRIIVVDTGDMSLVAGRGGRVVVETLERWGVDHVDLLIITHLDTDHYGGYRDLLKLPGAPAVPEGTPGSPRGPPILQVVRPEFDRGNLTAVQFNEEIAAGGIPIVTELETEALRDIEQRLGITIVAAPDPRTTNDSSLVVIVNDTDVEHGRHIITGDLTRKSWEKIAAQIPAEHVLSLMAPHHGADRVLVAMRKKLQPRITVVNANEDNRYGHPSLKVMRDLASQIYAPTPDLHPHEARVFQARHNAAADKEYVELLQNFYQVDRRALQLASLAEHTAAIEARNKAELIVLGTATSRPMSRQLRITGDHGTIVQHGANLQENRSLRDEILEEAVYRSLARLTDEGVSQLKTWSVARAVLLAKAEGDLSVIREYLAGTPGITLPAYAAEYVRIIMDLRHYTKDDAPKIRAVLEAEVPRAPEQAAQWQVLVPAMSKVRLPDREPINELRRAFDRRNVRSPDPLVEIRLPSEHRARTQDFFLQLLKPETRWRVAELLPQPLWQYDGAWRAVVQRNDVARRIVTPEEHFDATLRARGVNPIAERFKIEMRTIRARPRVVRR